MILSEEKFVPHTLEHLTEARVFPNPLPEVAYDKMHKEYDALTDVKVTRIAYESDGLRINGLVALPVKLNTGSHPILIYNRGGSREYGKLTLLSVMRSMVPYAKQGYLVYAPNYRGTEGGEGAEEFGGRDVEDVFGIMTLAEQHEAFDGKNRFMIGHSRGGMMTLLAIRRGAKLNAAVSIAGIADAYAMDRIPQMVERVLTPLIPGYAAGKEEALYERSAVRWPGDINVPLLMLHGDSDKDVPVGQSLMLAEKLREHHKLFAIHIYEGGGHALLRYWDDVTQRCTDWLERHRI